METIVKVITKKDKETGEVKKVEKTYRIDPEFVPTKADEICIEFIEAYCVAKGTDAINWLCDEYEKKHTNKKGKETEYPYVMLRADFCAKFFPAIAPKGTSKKTSSRADFLKKYRPQK